MQMKTCQALWRILKDFRTVMVNFSPLSFPFHELASSICIPLDTHHSQPLTSSCCHFGSKYDQNLGRVICKHFQAFLHLQRQWCLYLVTYWVRNVSGYSLSLFPVGVFMDGSILIPGQYFMIDYIVFGTEDTYLTS